jgi:TolB protein
MDNAGRPALASLLAALAAACARPAGGPPEGTCRADGACLLLAPSAGAESLQNPCYSPDGQRILFTLWHGGYNRGPAGLYVVPARGGMPVRMIDDGASNVNLPGSCWNGPAGRIAYASDRFGPDEIVVGYPDGSSATRVTTHSSGSYIEPSFSPEGARLVFEASLGPTSAEIWTIGADGAGAARLTSGGQDRQPNWSPSRAAAEPILFQRLGATWSIFVTGLGGSAPRQITPANDSSTDASFSPDGSRIVYSNGRSDIVGANLFVIGVAPGGVPQRLTTNAGYDGAPSWSPDGRFVAFESATSASGSAPAALWVIAAPP